MRDGKQSSQSVTQLVPGDIVFLKGGDVIPADVQVPLLPLMLLLMF